MSQVHVRRGLKNSQPRKNCGWFNNRAQSPLWDEVHRSVEGEAWKAAKMFAAIVSGVGRSSRYFRDSNLS
jgi:hypothetical protein